VGGSSPRGRGLTGGTPSNWRLTGGYFTRPSVKIRLNALARPERVIGKSPPRPSRKKPADMRRCVETPKARTVERFQARQRADHGCGLRCTSAAPRRRPHPYSSYGRRVGQIPCLTDRGLRADGLARRVCHGTLRRRQCRLDCTSGCVTATRASTAAISNRATRIPARRRCMPGKRRSRGNRYGWARIFGRDGHLAGGWRVTTSADADKPGLIG
jgi:hypothetical protein